MADQTLARRVNERSILTLLRASGAASRADLARKLGLTQATISRLVADMTRRGLLRPAAPAQGPGDEAGRDPGRPGILLELNPAGAYFVGVEIGVSIFRLVVLDLAAHPVEAIQIPFAQKPTPQQAVQSIAAQLQRLCADKVYRGRILGVGVTVPGLVTRQGFIVNLPILGWVQTDLRALLSAVTDLPVTIENNANAAAFAEAYAHSGLTTPFTLFLKLGTGCGGAAIVQGRLLRGADGTGLEPGHIGLGDPGQGALCHCGQRGCLETYVNLAALSRAWTGTPGHLPDLSDLPPLVAAAFDAGDPRAVAAVGAVGGPLARGLVALVNLFNPARVVLGGAMAPVLQRALPDLRTAVAGRIIPGTRMPQIQISPLGAMECAIGAACLRHQMSMGLASIDLAPLEPEPGSATDALGP